MPEVYNSTTVEFQTGPSRRNKSNLYTTISKFGLPILAGVSIGIGGVVFFSSFLAENSPNLLVLIFGLILVLLGLGILGFWKYWDGRKGGNGFTVLKPRVMKEYPETREPIVLAQEEEFMNQEGKKSYEMGEFRSGPKVDEYFEIPEQSHYKLRHFSSHGYGKKPINNNNSKLEDGVAPLAKAEDITPSLRSSYSSLAYVQEFDSHSDNSSISIDSSLFSELRL